MYNEKYAVLTNSVGYVDVDVFDTKTLAKHYMYYCAYADFVHHLRNMVKDKNLDLSAKDLLEIVKFNADGDSIRIVLSDEVFSTYEVKSCQYYDAFELEE